MSRKTFCVSFFLRKARTNKAGLTPILARITTNGISKEIYIQCSVPADKWNQSKERATGKGKLCQQVNSYLDDYRARILAVRQELIALRSRTIVIRFRWQFFVLQHKISWRI